MGADIAMTAMAAAEQAQQERRTIEQLKEELAELRGRAALADDVMAQIRKITATQATWEVQSLQIKQKWEGLLQAARHEMRLAQKGLTSGCGCPIGVCLGIPANDRMMACWKQWALSSAMVQSCNTHMDTLRTHAVHPARIANAERNKS